MNPLSIFKTIDVYSNCFNLKLLHTKSLRAVHGFKISFVHLKEIILIASLISSRSVVNVCFNIHESFVIHYNILFINENDFKLQML